MGTEVNPGGGGGTKETSERLSAVKTSLTLDEIIHQLPPERRLLLRELSRTDHPEYTNKVGETLLRLETSRQISLKEAQANVSTDNSAAIMGVISHLHSPVMVKKVLELARISEPELQDKICRGGSAISLAQYSRLAYWAWIMTKRADGMHLFAANVKGIGWGPVHELVGAYQQIQSTPRTYAAAGVAVKMFNRTKFFHNVKITTDSALINSTIFDWLRPMDDYPSRPFVLPIMSDIPHIAWGRYLEDIVGVSFREILEDYRKFLKGLRADGYRKNQEIQVSDPTIVTGSAMTQGVWHWWCKENPETVERYRLPQQIRAKAHERTLQFSLVEAIDFHRRLARELTIDFPVTNLREEDGILYADLHGKEQVIAHQVELTRDRLGRFAHRPLAATTTSIQTVWHIDVDLLWGHSAEWGEPIYVAEAGQLWEAPTSQWEFRWQNPPRERLGSWLRRTWHLIATSAQNPLKTIQGFVALRVDAERAAQATQTRYSQMYDQTGQELARSVREFLTILEKSEAELHTFRREWEARFQRFSDQYTYGHVERVTDKCVVFLAWLAYLSGPRPDWDRFVAVLQPNIENIPPNFMQDAMFERLWQLLRNLKIIGLIHDAGKAIIPPEILSATGRLTDDQIAIMKAHVDFGRLIGLALYPNPPMRTIVEIAMKHHENLDGTGYPDRLTAPDLCFLARLIRIIDVYDAMRGKRLYRTPHSIPRLKTIQVLSDDALRGKIDPWITEKFIRFVFWLRDDLRSRSDEFLLNLQISDKMIEFLKDTEVATEDLDEEIKILNQLAARRYPQQLPLPWEEQ